MNAFLSFLKRNFGIPRNCNWGYPFFIVAVATGLCFWVRCFINELEPAVPPTSLFGYSALIPALTVITLILPVALLSRNSSDSLIGEYTGIGAILISLLSGLPILLVRNSFHNLIAYLWLRLDFKMAFPAFFYLGGTDSTEGTLLAILSDTLIPAFGASLFFFGFMWTRFRSGQRRLGYYICGFFYAVSCLDPIDFLPLIVTGIWCGYLRTKTNNIYGPMACLLGARISGLFMTSILDRVDITSVMTYSDIDSTYFYSSIPAAFLGIVILAFIYRLLGNFYFMYFDISRGDDSYAVETEKKDKSLPPFVAGINPALYTGIVIFIIIWVFLLRGAHL